MRLLELFSGTGSVGRGFRDQGWEVLSLDVDPRSRADVLCNIMEWDYKQFAPGHFDCVWASPPCTEYSVARTTAKLPRNLWLADNLVQRALDIVAYFKPTVWWLENPHTGLLKTRPMMAGLPMQIVDYCMYGSPYRKRTALWGSAGASFKLCDKKCSAFADGKHTMTAQRRGSDGGHAFTRDELHALPGALVEEVERVTRSLIETGPRPA
jgi:hypothetical protein